MIQYKGAAFDKGLREEIEAKRREELRQERRAEVDDAHRLMTPSVDVKLSPIHRNDLERAEVLAKGTKRQRARAVALVRRVRAIYAALELRASVKAGMADRANLEGARQAELVAIGDVFGVLPKADGSRNGIASLLKAKNLTPGEARTAVTYCALWERHGPLMKSCLEQGVGGGGRADPLMVIVNDYGAHTVLGLIERDLTSFDDEGEVLHLMHLVARDGYCIRAVTAGGGDSIKAAVRALKAGLQIAARWLETAA